MCVETTKVRLFMNMKKCPNYVQALEICLCPIKRTIGLLYGLKRSMSTSVVSM